VGRQAIDCSALAPAIGPYSHAVRAGDTLYVSGTIPVEPVTGEVVGGSVVDQTERVLESLRILLESEGLSLGDVVKTTVFLSDMTCFTEMNEVYGRYFVQAPPARSTVAVLGLPKGVDVEIDCIAVYPE
jgi:2-iminobutanoate/2-iminopropanoate deaminase